MAAGDWDRLRRRVYRRAGHRCEICGASRGRRCRPHRWRCRRQRWWGNANRGGTGHRKVRVPPHPFLESASRYSGGPRRRRYSEHGCPETLERGGCAGQQTHCEPDFAVIVYSSNMSRKRPESGGLSEFLLHVNSPEAQRYSDSQGFDRNSGSLIRWSSVQVRPALLTPGRSGFFPVGRLLAPRGHRLFIVYVHGRLL